MIDHQPDHVTEAELAAIYKTTRRALESRRNRGQIPQGVWFYVFGKVHYSIREYEAWLESQRVCQLASKSSADQSASGSCGPGSAAAKPSPTRRTRKGSRPQPVFVLK